MKENLLEIICSGTKDDIEKSHNLADKIHENGRQNTGLHLAIIHRDRSDVYLVVELLLREIKNINAQNVDGDTALHLAVLYELLDVITLLLNKGASVTITNSDHRTPLQLAERLHIERSNYKLEEVKALFPSEASVQLNNNTQINTHTSCLFPSEASVQLNNNTQINTHTSWLIP